MSKILWIDDEQDLLKTYFLYIELKKALFHYLMIEKLP